MTTALQFVSTAMKNIGVLAANEAPTDDEANDGLDRLNSMLDSWNNESLTCFALLEQQLSLNPGQNQYTIGPGGYINGPRPLRLKYGPGAAYLLDGSGNRYPVKVVPQDQWNMIWNLTAVTSNLPDVLFYNPQFPLGFINVFPTPNIGGMTIFFDSYEALTEFPDLTTDVTFPAGYKLAIETNLSVFLKPFYLNAQLDPDVRMQAMESKGNIKRNNQRVNIAIFDAELSRSQGRPYSIYSDTYR